MGNLVGLDLNKIGSPESQIYNPDPNLQVIQDTKDSLRNLKFNGGTITNILSENNNNKDDFIVTAIKELISKSLEQEEATYNVLLSSLDSNVELKKKLIGNKENFLKAYREKLNLNNNNDIDSPTTFKDIIYEGMNFIQWINSVFWGTDWSGKGDGKSKFIQELALMKAQEFNVEGVVLRSYFDDNEISINYNEDWFSAYYQGIYDSSTKYIDSLIKGDYDKKTVGAIQRDEQKDSQYKYLEHIVIVKLTDLLTKEMKKFENIMRDFTEKKLQDTCEDEHFGDSFLKGGTVVRDGLAKNPGVYTQYTITDYEVNGVTKKAVIAVVGTKIDFKEIQDKIFALIAGKLNTLREEKPHISLEEVLSIMKNCVYIELKNLKFSFAQQLTIKNPRLITLTDEEFEKKKKEFADSEFGRNNSEVVQFITTLNRKGISNQDSAAEIEKNINKIKEDSYSKFSDLFTLWFNTIKGNLKDEDAKKFFIDNIEPAEDKFKNNFNDGISQISDEITKAVLSYYHMIMLKKDIPDETEKQREARLDSFSGYASNFNGTIGEIFVAFLLKQSLGDLNVFQHGSGLGNTNKQVIDDVFLKFKNENNTESKIGIQVKQYRNNALKLYETSVKLNEAQKYLNNNDINMLLFLIGNDTLLSDNTSDIFSFINSFLASHIDSFIRHSEQGADLRDNFYIINFNVIPASMLLSFLLYSYQTQKKVASNLYIADSQEKEIDSYIPDQNIFDEEHPLYNLLTNDKNLLTLRILYKGLTFNIDQQLMSIIQKKSK